MVYNVSFKWSESVYCSNIVITEKPIEAVYERYSEYECVFVTPGSDYDITDAKRRGKPIFKI